VFQTGTFKGELLCGKSAKNKQDLSKKMRAGWDLNPTRVEMAPHEPSFFECPGNTCSGSLWFFFSIAIEVSENLKLDFPYTDLSKVPIDDILEKY